MYYMYIVQGVLPNFGATLKIHKKSIFDQNQFKLSMQPKTMYIRMENSLLFNFSKIWPETACTIIIQGLWPNFGATSDFDWNQINSKPSTYVYMYLFLVMHMLLLTSWRSSSNERWSKD